METNTFFLREGYADIKICQYLPLDKLIIQLQRREYFIRQMKRFSDIGESKLPITLAFYPTEFGKNSSKNLSFVEHQLKKVDNYKDLSNSYVSCWTTENKENYLMWKSYGGIYGACIVSSITNFIASFNPESFSEYEVYGTQVEYRSLNYTDVAEDALFIKSNFYKSESEFRFLFLPKEDNREKELLEQQANIWLPCDFSVMIDKIILSPFIPEAMATFLRQSIESKFKLDVKVSKIKFKNEE